MSERRRRIVERIAHEGFATIDALARDFDVSAQTIRREVIGLAEAGIVQRFHGGAGLADRSVRLGYAQKTTIAAGGKHRIAEAAVSRIPAGASVFLDFGTTAEMVAEEIGRRGGFRVFTPSMPAAMRLAGRPGTDVFVTGGTVRGADGSLVGDAAIGRIGMFRVDVAIIGCSAFDTDGAAMDFDIDKVAVKNAMIANARQAMIVADSSKFEKHAIVRIAEPAAIALLATDARPDGELAEAFALAGTEILVG